MDQKLRKTQLKGNLENQEGEREEEEENRRGL